MPITLILISRLLLIEFVAATAVGHSVDNAMVRKDKHKMPIPVRKYVLFT